MNAQPVTTALKSALAWTNQSWKRRILVGASGLVAVGTLAGTATGSGGYINTSHLRMADWGSFSSAKQTAIAHSELHAWHDNGSVSDMKYVLDEAYLNDTAGNCSVDFEADSIEALHLGNYTHHEHTCDSATTGSETNINGQVITAKDAPAPAAPAPAPAPAVNPGPASGPAPAATRDDTAPSGQGGPPAPDAKTLPPCSNNPNNDVCDGSR